MEQNNKALSGKQTLDNKFMTVNDMAEILSIAKMRAYQLTKTKDFPCFYIGKRIIIPLQSFYEWVDKQTKNQSTLLELR